MALPSSALPFDSGIERLLESLAGVVSARIVAGAGGRLREIHILADGQIPPKQVVRNVESALRAGLGIEIDRRIVSVAQMRADAESRPSGAALRVAPRNGSAQLAPLAEPAGDVRGARSRRAAAAAAERLSFSGLDARFQDLKEATCRVTLQRGQQEFVGAGAGPNTVQGRIEAAARAIFAALSQALPEQDLGFESTCLLEAHGRTYVLVAAHGRSGRDAIMLTGAALFARSPEESAILAALQATNRWVDLPS
ncbi:MAG: hypothetical protein HY561_07120 [Gemmatimonadetes bacterium]|nr:hypothetical protein [Gemmatimonadota bacterium]